MPKVKKGDRKYGKEYTDEHIIKAIDAVQKGMSQRTASKKYGVPRSTIQFRMSPAFSKSSPGPHPVLGHSAEDDLVKWIIDCSRKGFPRRKENVQASVKKFLDHSGLKNPFHNNVPGTGWYKSFLKRNAVLSERCPEGVTSASSCVSESDIRNWFVQIHNYLVEENYIHILEDPSRIFNSDETYFMVCPKMKTVIAHRGARNVYEIDKANSKLNLTVLFTFSASGVTCPPTLVYPYIRLPAIVGRSVPNDWGIGVTPSGWMNGDLFFDYIKHIFYPYLIKLKITFPVILFIDGHSSHMTLEISKLCSELEIILICLYPNSTRILQPADVAAFKPLKTMWKKSVLEWRQKNPAQMLTLDRIAPILEDAIHNFSRDGTTIRNGFKACGLYPWDPNAVDYTKCLGTKKGGVIHNRRPPNEAAISFETFENVVGENLLDQLESFSAQNAAPEERSKEFTVLHRLLEEFKKTQNPTQNQEVQPAMILEKELPDLADTTLPIIILNDQTEDEMGLILNDLENNICDMENYNIKDSMTADVNGIIVNDKNAVTVTNSMCVHLDNSVITNPKTENNQVNDLNVNNIIYEISDEGIDKLMNKTENNEINDLDVTTNTIIFETIDEASNENYNDEALDLSLSHNSDCSKRLIDFLQRPPIPKRKGKNITQRKSYAISSLEWKLNEEKKFEQQKMERKKKDAKKCEILKKKQAAEKEKEAKKLARLLKQQKKNIKKEKTSNKENTVQNKRAKPIIISNETCPKKVYLVRDK